MTSVHWAMWLDVARSWNGSRNAGRLGSPVRAGKNGAIQTCGRPAPSLTPKARFDEKVNQKSGSGISPVVDCSNGAQRPQELVSPLPTLGVDSRAGGAVPSTRTT